MRFQIVQIWNFWKQKTDSEPDLFFFSQGSRDKKREKHNNETESYSRDGEKLDFAMKKIATAFSVADTSKDEPIASYAAEK